MKMVLNTSRDQIRLRLDCAYALSNLSLFCSHTGSIEANADSDQELDI